MENNKLTIEDLIYKLVREAVKDELNSYLIQLHSKDTKQQLLSQILKAEDIAKYLRISTRRAYEIFDIEGFPKIVIGRSKRVEREKFLDWLEEKKHIDVQ